MGILILFLIALLLEMMQEISFALSFPLPRLLTWASCSWYFWYLTTLLVPTPVPSSFPYLSIYMQLGDKKNPYRVDFFFFSHFVLFCFTVFLLFSGQLCFHMPISAAKIWLLAYLPSQNFLFYLLEMEPILERSDSFRNDWLSLQLLVTWVLPISIFLSSGHGDWLTNGHVTSSSQWDLFLERNSFSWGYEMDRMVAWDIWWLCCHTWVS